MVNFSTTPIYNQTFMWLCKEQVDINNKDIIFFFIYVEISLKSVKLTRQMISRIS